MAKKNKVEPTPGEHLEGPDQDLEAQLDQEMKDRTDSYNQDVVTEARELGINPDNFDNQEDLEGAIDTMKALKESENDVEA